MTSILFDFSLFGLVLLIAYKTFALKVREIGFLSSAFRAGDEKIHESIHLIIAKYNRYSKIARIFVFDFLPAYFYELLVKAKDYVAKKYYESAEDLRGRRLLKTSGSVSFFLEQLSEDK